MSGEEDEPFDDDDDEDLGPPVDLGALVPQRLPSVFLERVRLRIERRQVSADFASLFWSLPGTVLRGVLWGVSSPQTPESKEKSEGTGGEAGRKQSDG